MTMLTGNQAAPLLKLLQDMGMPKHVCSFKLECRGPEELITLECSFYIHEPKDGETYEDVMRIGRFVLEQA